MISEFGFSEKPPHSESITEMPELLSLCDYKMGQCSIRKELAVTKGTST